ncbi:hypothetical protein AB1Y20_017292 [Prymnesium parvum]|uniref:Carbamoyltransferase n=1 Tax=Prymnesium parvum TaxID=97485 RepID=A0AB34JJS2_PRYPA
MIAAMLLLPASHAPLLPATLPLRLRTHRHSSPRVARPPAALASSAPPPRTQWVVGLNQYSHDAGAALLSLDGEHSLVVPKERVTRVKCDGGATGVAVEHALAAVGATLDDVVAVCANNHHFRIAPYEQRLRWNVELGIDARECLSEFNLLPGVPKFELSHHLAHAWSVLAQAPFDEGLIVVMDGMGETLESMVAGLSEQDDKYTHELQLEPHPTGFVQVPHDAAVGSRYGMREAETVYSFRRTELRRVYKRWVAHRSPPELYNHGFAHLESLGAVYSRVSSHIFGDWNACGKVMGLAPWARRWAGTPRLALLRGEMEAGVEVEWGVLEALPHANGWKRIQRDAAAAAATPAAAPPLDAALEAERAFHTSLAASVQLELEAAVLPFLTRLRQRTGATNLVLVGGVALNSVLNGRIAREAGFERLFIPPCPGDDGVALGCATFALHQLLPRLGTAPPAPRRAPLSAYQGKAYTREEVEAAVEEYSAWLVDLTDDLPPADDAALHAALCALLDGEIVGWFHVRCPAACGPAARGAHPRVCRRQGRAEVGARALGHRSILADPRSAEMHRRVNRVKRREQFRPLAPSCLAEHASEWFDGLAENASPYMSITAMAREEKRALVPAVVHVDGSARLQTVTKEEVPRYHALLLAFFLACGVPMLMNTSFNLANMPIVESPADALACFLDASADLSLLVLGERVLRRRPFDAALDAIPEQARSFVSRSVATSSGEVSRAEVLVDGAWLLLADALSLEVLERCSGQLTSGQLADELIEESNGTIEQSEVEARLRELYEKRLVWLRRPT